MNKSSQASLKPNKKLKRGIQTSQARNAKTAELLYGIFPVQQALLHHKRSLSCLYIKEGPASERLNALCHLAEERGIAINKLHKGKLDHLCPSVPHQGVALACGPLPYAPDDLLNNPDTSSPPLFVALDQIEDPHNFGAIVRSCSFFDISGIIVPQQHSSPVTPAVSKTSAGVVEYFPVIAVANLARFLTAQKKKGYWIVGLDLRAEQPIAALSQDRPLILVVGNEGRGIRPLVHSVCDWHVTIPGNPEVSSLNVSNATAIALYQLSEASRPL